jgi:hypothetical protein
MCPHLFSLSTVWDILVHGGGNRFVVYWVENQERQEIQLCEARNRTH